MLVVMSFFHLLQDLYKVLIGRLNCAIHLRPIRQGSVMLDLEALEVVFKPLSYEIFAVIRDDGVWDPVPSDDVIPDEFFYCSGSNCLV